MIWNRLRKERSRLNDLVGEVALHVGAIRDDMDAVNSGLGKVIEAVSKQPSAN